MRGPSPRGGAPQRPLSPPPAMSAAAAPCHGTQRRRNRPVRGPARSQTVDPPPSAPSDGPLDPLLPLPALAPSAAISRCRPSPLSRHLPLDPDAIFRTKRPAVRTSMLLSKESAWLSCAPRTGFPCQIRSMRKRNFALHARLGYEAAGFAICSEERQGCTAPELVRIGHGGQPFLYASTKFVPSLNSASGKQLEILVMDSQRYFDLLERTAGLDNLQWTEEQRINLEVHEEQHINPEGAVDLTPMKAKASKASASKRQKFFSKAEDLTLVDAYLVITQDPIIGVDQSRDCYWKRINAFFHDNNSEDSGRTQCSLQHRWAVIQEQVSRFCACYTQVLNRNQSGMTRDNKLCEALVLYANEDKANKTFGLMHCFEKLENTEKWKTRTPTRPQKKMKTSSVDIPGSSSTSVFEDEATSPSKVVSKKRPPGIKKAKVAAGRAKSSSTTDNSSAMESFSGILECRESKRQERFELVLAMDKQRDEERLEEERKKLAIEEKKLALEEEKIQIMRMAEDRMRGAEESKIMSMDISGMDGEEQEFYKIRKSQIMNRYRNSSA